MSYEGLWTSVLFTVAIRVNMDQGLQGLVVLVVFVLTGKMMVHVNLINSHRFSSLLHCSQYCMFVFYRYTVFYSHCKEMYGNISSQFIDIRNVNKLIVSGSNSCMFDVLQVFVLAPEYISLQQTPSVIQELK